MNRGTGSWGGLWGSAGLLCSNPQPRGGWRYVGTEGCYKGFIGTHGGIWKDHEKMLGFIEGLWDRTNWDGVLGVPMELWGPAGLLCSAPHPNGGSYAGTEGCYKGFIGTHGIWKDHEKMLGVIEGLWGPYKLGWGPLGVYGDLQGFCAAPPNQIWGVMWGLRDVIRAS